MRTQIIGAFVVPFFFAGCTNQTATAYSTPTAHRASVNIPGASIPLPPNTVEISGRRLDVSAPDAISLSSVPVCDAAAIVLGRALSLDHSCVGEGFIGLEVAAGRPSVLLEAFTAAVERLGGSVNVAGQSVEVAGTQGGRVVGVGAPMPDGMPSGQSSTAPGGGEVFTIGDLDQQFEKRARNIAIQTRPMIVRAMDEAFSVEEVESLSESLGVSVQATSYGGRIYALGSSADMASLSPFLTMTDTITVPVDVGFASAAAVSSISSAYPDLTVSYDDGLGTLWLTGRNRQVSDAFHAVRSRVPVNRDIRVEAVFVSSSASDADSFSVDPQLSFVSGNAGVASSAGLIGAPALNLVVQRLQSYSSVNVISRPSLTTSSGRASEFVSGSRVPFVGEIDEEGRQSVEYQDTGIVLTVTPVLLPTGLIRLAMTLEISEVAGAGVLDNPAISTRSVQTTVEISPGDVVKLSGLQDRSNAVSDARTFSIFPSKGASSSDSTLSFFVSAALD